MWDAWIWVRSLKSRLACEIFECLNLNNWPGGQASEQSHVGQAEQLCRLRVWGGIFSELADLGPVREIPIPAPLAEREVCRQKDEHECPRSRFCSGWALGSATNELLEL